MPFKPGTPIRLRGFPGRGRGEECRVFALYPGSFDPVTNGHVDVVRQTVSLVDRLVVAIGVHPGKKPLFTTDERLEMVRDVFSPIAAKTGCEIDCMTFDDLTVSAAKRVGATILIRGLRDGTDMDYEMQIAGMNETMAPDVQTVVSAGIPYGAPDHRHTGAPDRRDGRGRLELRTHHRGVTARVQFAG